MGYFSQLDIEKRSAQNDADDETTEMDLRAKAEERDDARQAAEAEAAEKARLDRLANPTTEDLLKEILAELKNK